MEAQFLVPFSFQDACHEPVVGIRLHISPPRQLGFITHAFCMLTPDRVGLGDTPFDLLLDGDRHFERQRRHQLQQQLAHRRIDDLPRHILTDSTSATHHISLTHIIRDDLVVLAPVADAHPFTTQPAQHAPL